MDERERDKFYSEPANVADDDEYELESPDASVVSAETRHAQEIAESANAAIDLDDIYREAERQHGGEILEQWIRDFRFHFQVKHLLMATAVLAIALTLSKFGLLWMTLIILLMLSIAVLYGYVRWEERKHEAEVDRKRRELYARRREQFGARGAAPAGDERVQASATTRAAAPPASNEVDEMWQAAIEREPFRFRFSLSELIIAMTAAAVILGMIRILGGAAPTATILGFVALFGLVAHAMGFEAPQSVILGWWFILVLYVLLSIFAAVWSSLT